MGSLDDFFNKKDKSKKGKGFVTFKEEVDKKQKEIERQKRNLDEEANGDQTIQPTEKPPTVRNATKDEWNEVLERSVLNDVFPDEEEFEEDAEVDATGILYDDQLDSDTRGIISIDTPVPLGMVLAEIAKIENEPAVKPELETQDLLPQSDEIKSVVMVEEDKKMTRFGPVINRKTQDVKIDSQEDFPMLSMAVIADTKKSKKKSQDVNSHQNSSDHACKSSSSGRFFTSKPSDSVSLSFSNVAPAKPSAPASATTAPVKASAVQQEDDSKKPRFFSATNTSKPSTIPAVSQSKPSASSAPSSSASIQNTHPTLKNTENSTQSRFSPSAPTAASGGSKFFNSTKQNSTTPVSKTNAPSVTTSIQKPNSTNESSVGSRKLEDHSMSNSQNTPSNPTNSVQTKAASTPRFFRS